ncbi:MAG TPA: spermidine/putrescine ABC transporter substrate-binding protein [Thermoleophilaceae bacterium]|nr:spermidine/putrescine ABC transporter substrate-binding protein [Thermoleophilaceae bacterium]
MSDRDYERMFEEVLQRELDRRRFLRQAGVGVAGLSAMSLLAACGGDDGIGGGEEKEAKQISGGKVGGTLAFSNWPLYIDIDDKTKAHPTLDQFDKKYKAKVKYTEEINDNVEFFGKVRPQYERGDSGGRDLHVVTDWLCARMERLGYVQKFDKSKMPNAVKNIEDAVASPDFDPKREVSMPWQSGQVLPVWRSDLTGGDLTSVNDLFDPKFKGKVTMLSEMRDSVGAVLLADGKKPEDADLDTALTAVERIEKAAKDGQIRAFTGNEFVRGLLKGDSVAVLAWSGDSVQLLVDDPKIRFVQPKEGFMVFTDSMQIPVGAPNAATAQKMIDFVYEPEVQAQITAYVNYVPPVKGVREILEKEDPEIVENKLIFPDLALAHNFATLSPEDERELDSAFQRAIGA